MADASRIHGHRERLLDAALRMIAVRGYQGVRLRDIALEAGVTTGMIQHYFASRDELLTTAMERMGLAQIEAWASVTRDDQDPLSRLRAFVTPPTGPGSDPEQAAAWLQFCSAASFDDNLRGVLQRVYRRWRELIQEAIELGIQQQIFAPRLPPAAVAETLILLLDGSEVAVGSRAGNLSPGDVDELTMTVIAELLGVDIG